MYSSWERSLPSPFSTNFQEFGSILLQLRQYYSHPSHPQQLILICTSIWLWHTYAFLFFPLTLLCVSVCAWMQVCMHLSACECGQRLALHVLLQVPSTFSLETGSSPGLELTSLMVRALHRSACVCLFSPGVIRLCYQVQIFKTIISRDPTQGLTQSRQALYQPSYFSRPFILPNSVNFCGKEKWGCVCGWVCRKWPDCTNHTIPNEGGWMGTIVGDGFSFHH